MSSYKSEQVSPSNSQFSTEAQLAETNLRELVHELKAHLVNQNQRVSQLEAQLANSTVPNNSFGVQQQLKAVSPNSRRRFLKRWGSLATGLAVATTALAVQAQPAEAASGENMVIGNSNLAGNPTYLSQSNSTSPDAIFQVDWNSSAQTSIPIGKKIALAGTSEGYGAYLQGTVAPLFIKPVTFPATNTGHQEGEILADTTGKVWYYTGTAWSELTGTGSGGGGGTGAFLALQSTTPGSAQSGNFNMLGKGIIKAATNNIGLELAADNNYAPLQIKPAAITGIPTGAHQMGELYVDSVGKLWYCVGGTGSGAWKELTSTGATGSYVRTNTADTITVQHTFNPATAQSPFILGANAQNQKVVGLDADKVDGKEAADFVQLQNNVDPLNAQTGGLNLKGNGQLISLNTTTPLNLQANNDVAPLRLTPATAAGVPTTGNHFKGEIYIDSQLAVYLCVVNGTPGTWRKLSGSDSSQFYVFSSPDRFLDTRSTSPRYPSSMSLPATLTSSTTYTTSLASQGLRFPSTNIIPSDAKAVMGTLTILADASNVGNAFLVKVFPTTITDTQAISQASGTASLTLVVPLTIPLTNSTYSIKFWSNLVNYNLILDLAGYYL